MDFISYAQRMGLRLVVEAMTMASLEVFNMT
jgi:hypothetical protein